MSVAWVWTTLTLLTGKLLLFIFVSGNQNLGYNEEKLQFRVNVYIRILSFYFFCCSWLLLVLVTLFLFSQCSLFPPLYMISALAYPIIVLLNSYLS